MGPSLEVRSGEIFELEGFGRTYSIRELRERRRTQSGTYKITSLMDDFEAAEGPRSTNGERQSCAADAL